MTEYAPQPLTDTYRLPTCPVEVLEDELRTYPDAASFKEGLSVLSTIYGKTTLAQSFARASRLLFMANYQNGLLFGSNINPARHIDAEFYGGSILGLHSVVRPMQSDQRRWVYMSDTLGLIDPSHFGDQASEAVQQGMDYMADYRSEGWVKTFEEALPDDVQFKVYEAATTILEGPQSEASSTIVAQKYCVDTFMAGYTYAVDSVNEALDNRPKIRGAL